MREEDPRRPLLPAPFGACGDGYPPNEIWDDGYARMLVVQLRVQVQTQPLHRVPGTGPVVEKIVGGCRRGVQVGAPTNSLGQTAAVCKGGRRSVRVLAHKSRLHRSGKGPSGGQGVVSDGEEGELGPP